MAEEMRQEWKPRWQPEPNAQNPDYEKGWEAAAASAGMQRKKQRKWEPPSQADLRAALKLVKGGRRWPRRLASAGTTGADDPLPAVAR